MTAAIPPVRAERLSSVLVVDDQAQGRELLLDYLASIPCQVREAVDGESALAAVAEAPPDLILLDVMMPGLNGYAVTRRLKTDPRTATIPVVLVTSLQETADRLKGLQAGADEFLTKPVDRAELIARVATLLRLKRLRDERQAVGDLGQRALTGIELSALMAEAAALVGDTLRVDCVGVWDLLGPGNALSLWAGVGWRDGLVGQATASADADSQIGYTLQAGAPVVVEDLRADTHFSGPPLLLEHELTSGISVVIDGTDRRSGVLSVHTCNARAFTKDDIYFVESIAQVLATAIIRKRAEAERVRALLSEQAARANLEESHRALARTTQAKSDFLAAMSQEMNATANSILRSSERILKRLADDSEAAEPRELASDIQDRGQLLMSLARDVLDLARIEAGHLRPQPTAFDLESALYTAQATVRPLAEKKGIALVAQVADAATVHADRGKLEQVLSHLLSNAVKFSPPGGLVETTACLTNGAIEVAVSDTGFGIPREDQERIFEPFQQLNSAAALQDKGAGLGLTVARHLVELQGGQIRVDSALGEGSRFIFTIPTSSAAPSAGSAPPSRLQEPLCSPTTPALELVPAGEHGGSALDAASYALVGTESGEEGGTWAGVGWPGFDSVSTDSDREATTGGA